MNALGIEFGSTRIKAILINENYETIATGVFDWENTLVGGLWSYDLDYAVHGMQSAYSNLARDFERRTGEPLAAIDAIGISGMMHGYLAFDKDMNLLTPFRTWRNTNTTAAADLLTEALDFNIPLRWSVAHVTQAVIDGEAHVKDIAYVTTLAGYAHTLLTGEKCVGIGEASGMFPLDGHKYNEEKIKIANGILNEHGVQLDLSRVFPSIKLAGEIAGRLTESGAKLLDPSGRLTAGIPFCPPEGDAGTGMVATNSVRNGTGNISCGTSAFAMVTTDKPLRLHREIDMIATPSGLPVAMAHANTCTSDINAWVGLFGETASMLGGDASNIYETLFRAATKGDMDCGGVVSYNCFAGEPVIGLDRGAPLITRKPGVKFTLANFMLSLLYSSIATIRRGMDILLVDEGVNLAVLYGHGGLFKTEGVAQEIIASALSVPVCVMNTAGEGGAWGMAILAMYCVANAGVSLEDYLSNNVFANAAKSTVSSNAARTQGFNIYMNNFDKLINAERIAGDALGGDDDA